MTLIILFCFYHYAEYLSMDPDWLEFFLIGFYAIYYDWFIMRRRIQSRNIYYGRDE